MNAQEAIAIVEKRLESEGHPAPHDAAVFAFVNMPSWQFAEMVENLEALEGREE